MCLELSERQSHLRRLIRNRNLGLVYTAGLISQTGDWIFATGVAFQIYVITGSAVASATVLFFTQLPQAVLGSIAGVLVDRWDRRRTMIAVNLALSAVILPLVVVRHQDQVWIIDAVVAASSCLTPFFTAAEASLVPLLVDQQDSLVTANAVNAQVRNVSRLVGAALGGLVIVMGGLTLLATTDAVSFGVAACLIAAIRHRSERAKLRGHHLAWEWREGLSVIVESRTLTVIAFFFAVSGVGEAAMGSLFAPFVHDVLGGSGDAFGIILAAQAVGGIVGGALITVVGHRFAPRALFGWGSLTFGVLDLVLFLYPLVTDRTWPAVLVIGLVGLPGAALGAGLLTLFQLVTRDEVRGRVFGALTSVQNAAMLTSALIAGAIADRIGIIPVITVQGGVYVVSGVVVLIALRPTRRFPQLETVTPDRSVDIAWPTPNDVQHVVGIERTVSDRRRSSRTARTRASLATEALQPRREKRIPNRRRRRTPARDQSCPGQPPPQTAREVRLRRTGGGA